MASDSISSHSDRWCSGIDGVARADAVLAPIAVADPTGSVRVEVLGRGGVEEPAELLDLVGCALVAL
jgi:hypothetical protein